MAKQAILHLNLKRMYFDAIANKKKRTEYRAYTPYWKSRLLEREYDLICFRNGYSKKAPQMMVQFLGVRRAGTGRSADFAIRLGRILEIKRWRH
jgi:hypothetical protein